MAGSFLLPRAARVVVPLGLALVFASQSLTATLLTASPLGCAILAFLCGLLALDVFYLAVPDWGLTAMVESGMTLLLASATPAMHAAVALERAFDYRGAATAPACWAIAAGAGIAVAFLMAVSAFKEPT